MGSKKKKKIFIKKKSETSAEEVKPVKEIKKPFSLTSVRFAAIVTTSFFLLALIGLLNHEMWRDEHQAWLVARDANSLSQLLDNMKYEGNPALWHFFLFGITRFTHDPIYMQAFHLLLATSFIFIFNRFAPFSNLHKVLFSFGYFPLYEYAVISRSYVLGILLIFGICALYKYRLSRYILIGILLALLSNVTIYAVVIAGCIAGVMVLDYLIYQEKKSKTTLQLSVGILIFIAGLAFSLYQIWPEKDNSFPAPYATTLFDFPRWWQVFSKLFTTYFYVPNAIESFWNSSIFFNDQSFFDSSGFSLSLDQHPEYYLTWIIMPLIIFISGIVIFLRKPLVLLIYISSTIGLLSIFYYTVLVHARYCGYLLIALVVCYWLSEYYPGKKLSSGLSLIGSKIQKPFLTIVLSINVIGAIIAYSMDLKYDFSPSKKVAEYIKSNKLDSLPIIGITDFTISPLATYLDTKIYYPQMNDMGSFTIWNSKRLNQMSFNEMINSVGKYIDDGKNRILLIKDTAPQITLENGKSSDMEKAVVRNNLQVDLLKKFNPGIVNDEKYYIYLVQKVDPSKVDYSKYIQLN